MPRKTTPPTVIEHTDIAQPVIDNIAQDVNQLSEHSANILARFGEGEAIFVLRTHEDEARMAMERGARAMIDAGRHLIVIKEHVAHGEWTESLDRIGIAPRMAQKFMQAAYKFLSSPGSKKLLDHVGSKSKALELLVLDEGDMEQLGSGGTVAGLTLDDIDCMSVTEMRKALREARESQEDQQRIIADKNKKIDDQSKQISRIKRLPPDEVAKKMRTEIASMQSDIEEEIRVNFFNGLSALIEQGGDDHQEFIKAQLQMLDDAVQFLRVNFSGNKPEWEKH